MLTKMILSLSLILGIGFSQNVMAQSEKACGIESYLDKDGHFTLFYPVIDIADYSNCSLKELLAARTQLKSEIERIEKIGKQEEGIKYSEQFAQIRVQNLTPYKASLALVEVEILKLKMNKK